MSDNFQCNGTAVKTIGKYPGARHNSVQATSTTTWMRWSWLSNGMTRSGFRFLWITSSHRRSEGRQNIWESSSRTARAYNGDLFRFEPAFAWVRNSEEDSVRSSKLTQPLIRYEHRSQKEFTGTMKFDQAGLLGTGERKERDWASRSDIMWQVFFLAQCLKSGWETKSARRPYW